LLLLRSSAIVFDVTVLMWALSFCVACARCHGRLQVISSCLFGQSVWELLL
jgi:hypothetical protein